MIATPLNVREIGGLPDEVEEPKILAALSSAERRLKRWIGGYSDASGDKKEACIEAEVCFAMINLLPILNTFYPEMFSKAQVEVGETDFVFNKPGNLEILKKHWLDRAREAVSEYIEDTSNLKKPQPGASLLWEGV